MAEFVFLDKTEKEAYLPRLFELLYNNMNEIAPSGESREEDFASWYGAVSPALDKAARQVVLILDGERLIGYFQYFVNDTTFMMEEIQLEKSYHCSGVFNELYRFLRPHVPETVPFAEAYAHKLNLKSQGILRHLGLEEIGENTNGSCLRFRGSCAALFDTILGR